MIKMRKKFNICNTTLYKGEEFINELLKNPKQTFSKLAEKFDTYRQNIWRKIKRLEKEKVIWGYTTVIDDEKIGWKTFVILMKVKPFTEEVATLQIKRQKEKIPERDGVRIIECLYVNGPYQCINIFAAKDLVTAQRYYDTLRGIYADALEEKPTLMDVTFASIKHGKINPEIEKLKKFVPIEDQESEK